MRSLGEYLAVLAEGDSLSSASMVSASASKFRPPAPKLTFTPPSVKPSAGGNGALISSYCKASSEFYDPEACRRAGGCPETTCPTCPVCPAPTVCPTCPTFPPVEPSAAQETGFAWWWLLVAFAGGYGIAKMR